MQLERYVNADCSQVDEESFVVLECDMWFPSNKNCGQAIDTGIANESQPGGLLMLSLEL